MILYTQQEILYIKDAIMRYYGADRTGNLFWESDTYYAISEANTQNELKTILNRKRINISDTQVTTAGIMLCEIPFENLPMCVNHQDPIIKTILLIRFKLRR